MRDVNPRWRARARPALAFAGLASLAAGLLLLPAASPSAAQVAGPSAPRHAIGTAPLLASGRVPHASAGSPVTVTGKNLWNPATGKPLTQPSTVTVGQTTGLTDQLVNVSWKNFTPSISNAAGPFYTNLSAWYAVEVLECKGTNPTVYTDCYQADTQGTQFASGPSGPPNNTYAITTSAGTGQLNILVETSLVNSVLGCDQTHPCSLVVIPGQGGLPGGTPAGCANHTGDVGFGGTGNALAELTFAFTSVGGATGPCSWNDRLVVPLSFAPVPTGCPQRAAAFQASGSPVMAPAMARWLTGLCAGSGGMTVAYNSTVSEPTAVGQAVSGLSDVAFTTRPASADGVVTTKPFVYAPIAVSAISIDYWIDDNILGQPGSGQPLSGLKLNQRLLAKLLTTSYNPAIACPPGQTTNCDPGVSGNPFDVVLDPEFKALNPSISSNVTTGFANLNIAPTVVSGPSDMTWTVTRWIGADPTATAFLAGTADQYKTHVNTYYTGLKYPVDTFTPQDPNTVWSQEYSPVFPLSQAVTYQALNENSGSIIPVPPPQTGYSKDPPEPVGDRALFAVLDEGDAALNQFPTAAIPNAAGNYVQPDATTMAAAVSHMVSNGSGTLQVNLADKTPNAYPLTMVIYAMCPTSGLSPAKAAAIARFLNFAAGAGQTPGTAPGQLAPGYLPLPASLAAQTKKLAVQVAKQTGNTSSGTHGTGTGNRSGTGTGTGSGTGSGSGSSPAGTSHGTPGTSSGTHQPVTHSPISLVSSHAGPAAMTRFALPALLILGALMALGGSSALAGSAEGGIPGRLRWLRQTTAAQTRRARTLIPRRKP
jgi:hypothetical protein